MHPTEQLSREHIILMSHEPMWCYACSWDVRGDLTLNSMAQIHTSVTLLTSRNLAWSSSRLKCQAHLSHFCCRTHFVRRDVRVEHSSDVVTSFFPEMEEILIEKVCQQNFLYATKSLDYIDQHMRANAWEGIGKELKIKCKFYVFTCMWDVSSRDVRIVCSRPYISLQQGSIAKYFIYHHRNYFFLTSSVQEEHVIPCCWW